MALAGISAVGEFHYLHHGPGGAPYADPNAMGEALIAAAAEAGLRITLLDTCYLRGGHGVELDATQRRFSDGDARAWAARVGPAAPTRTACASAPPSTPCGRWTRRASTRSPGPAADGGGPAARPRVRAAGRERAVLASYGRHADGAAGRCRRARRARSRPSTPPTSPGATSACSAGAAAGAACARRPSAISPTGSARRAPARRGRRLTLGSDSHAVIDLLEEARRRRARRAARVRRARPPRRGVAAADGDGERPRQPRLARRRADRAGALADLTTIGLDSVRTAGARRDALDTAVFAATAADVHHVVVGGRVVVADGRHTTLRRVGELRAVLDVTTVVEGIGLLVTNTDAGELVDAHVVVEDRSWSPSARAARRPTSGSTSTAAA